MGKPLQIDEDALAHYGVLGMHWGVRRSRRARVAAALSKPAHSKGVHDDHKEVRELEKKNIKELSNADLKKLTTRLQLEQQYKNLKPSKRKRNMAIVKGVLGIGKTASDAYNLYNSPLGQEAQRQVKKRARRRP